MSVVASASVVVVVVVVDSCVSVGVDSSAVEELVVVVVVDVIVVVDVVVVEIVVVDEDVSDVVGEMVDDVGDLVLVRAVVVTTPGFFVVPCDSLEAVATVEDKDPVEGPLGESIADCVGLV